MPGIYNIYPPIVPTYANPFTIGDNDKCIVPVSISKYNSRDELSNVVQVTVFEQSTSISALDPVHYPCGIMLTALNGNETSGYHIEITPADIKNGKFEINTYYRIQIRFIKNGVSIPNNYQTEPQKISDWLIKYQQNFSEWSTVCLARGILKPILSIKNIGNNSNENNPTIWRTGNVDIVGTLTFGNDKNSAETDYLKEYVIKLYDLFDNLIFDSGTIYGNAYVGVNEINYTIKRIFKEGEEYRLDIYYLTKTGYSDTVSYYLEMLDEGTERLEVNFNVIEDSTKGRITLNIQGLTSKPYKGNIIIRRTEGDSNFTIWEDVANIYIEDELLDIVWNDYTVQSGKWYRYGVQTKTVDEKGNENRGILVIYDKDLMIEFDDIFLNAENAQICIRYNPQISSFQHVVLENKVETIGNKYPYIKRNGNTNYKQFSISGTITYYMDNYDNNEIVYDCLERQKTNMFNKRTEPENIEDGNSLFTSKEQMYGEEILSLYDDRMTINKSNTLDTVIYEKDFRDKVKEFLYNNDVKLFRSATEGNILVKLMNITFVPNQSLGRTVWTFNANAYEIDEYSIENCNKYKIQTIGTAIVHSEYINNYIGQFNGIVSKDKDVILLLENEYQKYCKPNYKAEIQKITYLRIQFNEKPYLIKMPDSKNNVPTVAVDGDIENTMVGYLVTLGTGNKSSRSTTKTKTIVVSTLGIYELKAEDVAINSISFPKNSNVTIDYEIELSQQVDIDKSVKSIVYRKKIGQLWDTFDQNKELILLLRNLYDATYKAWYKELLAVNGMHIEADEGIIIYVREKDEEGYQKHVIGPTESLDFYDPDSIISGGYFYGRHFTYANENEMARNNLAPNKIIDSGETAIVEEDIVNPQLNNVYLIGPVGEEKRELYYQNKWYDIDENNDIECPVIAIVDYYCEYVRGYYAK